MALVSILKSPEYLQKYADLLGAHFQTGLHIQVENAMYPSDNFFRKQIFESMISVLGSNLA